MPLLITSPFHVSDWIF